MIYEVDRAENNVIMDMSLVNVRREYILMLPLCYCVGKLPPDLMGFLIVHFPRRKLVGKIAEQGYTLVPVEVYFKGSLVKVQIALAKGKKLYDKRQDIAKKDMRREAERDFKIRNLG